MCFDESKEKTIKSVMNLPVRLKNRLYQLWLSRALTKLKEAMDRISDSIPIEKIADPAEERLNMLFPGSNRRKTEEFEEKAAAFRSLLQQFQIQPAADELLNEIWILHKGEILAKSSQTPQTFQERLSEWLSSDTEDALPPEFQENAVAYPAFDESSPLDNQLGVAQLMIFFNSAHFNKNKWNLLANKLRQVRPFKEREMQHIRNIWNISQNDRFRLFITWWDSKSVGYQEEINKYLKHYASLVRQWDAHREALEVTVLRQAHVIGMTTTGAAKHRNLLRIIKPPVVLIEEAAEILEQHVLTALG